LGYNPNGIPCESFNSTTSPFEFKISAGVCAALQYFKTPVFKFKTHEKDMRKFAKSIPKQAITTQKIVSKHIEKSTEKPSLYAVTYEYAYSNKNLVQYDVGFDKAGGSTKIRSFDVKLYGASTD
jgi:hypothetical protein